MTAVITNVKKGKLPVGIFTNSIFLLKTSEIIRKASLFLLIESKRVFIMCYL